MPIVVTCTCGRQFKAREEHLGRQASCPKCGASLLIGPPPVPVPDAIHVSMEAPALTVAKVADEPSLSDSSQELPSNQMSPGTKKAMFIGGSVLAAMLIASITVAIVSLSDTGKSTNTDIDASRVQIPRPHDQGKQQVQDENDAPSKRASNDWDSVLEEPLSYDLNPIAAFRQLERLWDMSDSLPQDHHFQIVAKLNSYTYEAVITDSSGVAVTDRLILKTVVTEFKSTGLARLIVYFDGNTEVQLSSGFTKRVSVYREAMSDTGALPFSRTYLKDLTSRSALKTRTAKSILVATMLHDGYEQSNILNAKTMAQTQAKIRTYLGIPLERGSSRRDAWIRTIGSSVSRDKEEGVTALSYARTTRDEKLIRAVLDLVNSPKEK